jgi:hypothetical protein
MMNPSRFHLIHRLGGIAALAFAVVAAPAQVNPDLQTDQEITMHIKEVGLLRTLIITSPDSRDLANQVRQRFVDSEYEVYTDAINLSGNVTSAQMRAAGERENADMIVYARISGDRLRSNASGFKLYEATAVVQVFNRVTGREVVTKEVRASGIRHPDDFEARRSAREKAMQQATREAQQRTLDRMNSMMVHHFVVVNIFSESDLLAKMEYLGKMEDVYDVRRLDYDRFTREAKIEVIARPRSRNFWRAYMEKMPKTKVSVDIIQNESARRTIPDWFN